MEQEVKQKPPKIATVICDLCDHLEESAKAAKEKQLTDM